MNEFIRAPKTSRSLVSRRRPRGTGKCPSVVFFSSAVSETKADQLESQWKESGTMAFIYSSNTASVLFTLCCEYRPRHILKHFPRRHTREACVWLRLRCLKGALLHHNALPRDAIECTSSSADTNCNTFFKVGVRSDFLLACVKLVNDCRALAKTYLFDYGNTIS